MPQKRKPPRLWYREDTGTWFIKDGSRRVSTGCAEDETEDAERQLAEYIAQKYEAPRGGRSTEISIADILTVYLDEKADETSRPRETNQAIGRLNEFFGEKMISEVRGKTCREFAAHRKTPSGARRDLETFRAALHYYHKEYGLDVLPAITLPEKSTPRDRYLTRPEAAALLWACMGWELQKDKTWKRRRDQKRGHLARLVIIGLYTGTRLGAILNLQWVRSTTGGYADLEKGVIFRRAEGERVAHNKRKTPVKMARRLKAHMRRWKSMDGWMEDQVGLRYIAHYNGEAITKPHKAFRSARRAAGLDDTVTPHVLRHTRGTWLAQASVPASEAAASLGLTEDEYERTYLHNDPDFQKGAADAY